MGCGLACSLFFSLGRTIISTYNNIYNYICNLHRDIPITADVKESMSILLTRKNPLQPLEFTKSVIVDSHPHKDPGCVKWGISWNARSRNIPRRLWRSGKGHNPESCRCTSYYPPEVSSHEVTFATKVGTVFLLVACTKAAAKSLFYAQALFTVTFRCF